MLLKKNPKYKSVEFVFVSDCLFVHMSTVSTGLKRRKVVSSEGRKMIASVYRFLKEEYEFTVTYQEANCDFSHLRNISQRTADATGVSVRTVHQILKEERESSPTPSNFKCLMKKRRKEAVDTEIDSLGNMKKQYSLSLPPQAVNVSRKTVHHISKEERDSPSPSSDFIKIEKDDFDISQDHNLPPQTTDVSLQLEEYIILKEENMSPINKDGEIDIKIEINS